MTLELPKGMRDFPPADALLRQRLLETLRAVFERYGFVPLETPVVERMEVLASKYAGGSEIVKEVFKVEDQGGRGLGLRYDLTVPLARYIGMNPSLRLPFKRYAVGPVFRDGPIKLGRYREFWQCDVDIVGAKGLLADAECVRIALAAFSALGLEVTVQVNSRQFLDELLLARRVPKDKLLPAILALDKLTKYGAAQVRKELGALGLAADVISGILDFPKGTNEEKLAAFSAVKGGGLPALKEVFTYLSIPGVEFVPSLARGLAYYTGTVFEVYLKKSDIASSVAAGGRYDRMIGDLLGRGEYPAVGISFGLDVIFEALRQKNPALQKSPARVFCIPIQTDAKTLEVCEALRAAGVSADMDFMGRGISKNLDYANAMGIPYALILGQKELAERKVKLKDMKTGKERLLAVNDVITELARR